MAHVRARHCPKKIEGHTVTHIHTRRKTKTASRCAHLKKKPAPVPLSLYPPIMKQPQAYTCACPCSSCVQSAREPRDKKNKERHVSREIRAPKRPLCPSLFTKRLCRPRETSVPEHTHTHVHTCVTLGVGAHSREKVKRPPGQTMKRAALLKGTSDRMCERKREIAYV